MRKILISAPEILINKLEEKLRHKYDVQIKTIPNDTNAVCEIKAKVGRDMITICRFACNENLKDILTMFEVNYELRTRSRK
jgi:P2-related tail formation protein